jgi:hypothetical protein
MPGFLGPRARHRAKARRAPVANLADAGDDPVGMPTEEGAEEPRTFGERRADQVNADRAAAAEVVAEIAADPTLVGRPALRRYRQVLRTMKLQQLDGSPLTLPDGTVVHLTLEQALIQCGVTAACSPGPRQYEFWRDCMTYLFGRPPQDAPSSSPPPAPPGSSPGETAPAAPDLPPEEQAREFMRMMGVMKQIADQGVDGDRQAIDVKGELVAQLGESEPKP